MDIRVLKGKQKKKKKDKPDLMQLTLTKKGNVQMYAGSKCQAIPVTVHSFHSYVLKGMTESFHSPCKKKFSQVPNETQGQSTSQTQRTGYY